MRTKCGKWVCMVLTLALVVFSGSLVFAGEMTITGTVNDNLQVVENSGQVYEIGDTDAGNELAAQVDAKVKVTGTVEEVEGQKVISVTSYEVLE